MAAEPTLATDDIALRSSPQINTLDSLPKGFSATIADLREADGQAMADHLERLMELGFLPGETVRIIAKGMPSGEPIAVRIGQATFALRRFEAAWIRVRSPRKSES